MSFETLTQPEFYEFQDKVVAEIKQEQNAYSKNKKEEKIVTDVRTGFRPKYIKPGTCLRCVFNQGEHSFYCVLNAKRMFRKIS